MQQNNKSGINSVMNLGNGFMFGNLQTKHVVTSDDFGNVRYDVLGKKPNGLTTLLNRYFQTDNILTVKPVHGDDIITVFAGDDVNGASADGIIFIRKCEIDSGDVIAFSTGDCPLILIEGKNQFLTAVGIIHSGWSGTALNIAAKAIDIFYDYLGIQIKDLNIGLWTGICPDCFEIGRDVYLKLCLYNQFLSYKSRGKWQANLAGIITHQLQQAGVTESQIEQSNICPHCHSLVRLNCTFSSHRRGDSNRNGAIIQA